MSDTIDELVDDPMLRQRLERHLASLAHDATLRPSPLSGIRARAARRRRRKRLAGVVAASALSVLAVVAALSASSTPPAITPADVPPLVENTTDETSTSATSINPTDSVASQDDGDAPLTSTTATIAGVLGSSAQTWRAATPDQTSAAVIDQVYPATGMHSGHVVWTTMEQSPPEFTSSVSTSSDGEQWTPVATSPGIAVIGGTERDGALFLIGYAPDDDPAAGALLAATSVDGGRTWQRTALGYDLSAAWESGVVKVSLTASQVDVRDGVIVASIEPQARLDIDAIAGADAMMNGYVIGDDGIELLSPCEPSGAPCFSGPAPDAGGREVERILTWEEAGLDERERSYLDDRPFLVRIENGRAERVFDLPSTYPGGTRLGQGGLGFLALVQTYPEQAPGTAEAASLFSSVDGRTWALLGRPPVHAGAVGFVNDRVVVAGPSLDTGSTIVLASADGKSWQQVELPVQGAGAWEPMPYGAAIADGRIALLLARHTDPQLVRQVENGVVLESEDGMGDAVVYDEATGAVLGGWTSAGGYTGRVRKGDDASMVVTDESGAVIAEFTLDEAMQAMQEQMKPGETEMSVVISDDVWTWSWTSLNALVDEPLAWAEFILMTHDGVMVPAQIALDPDFATTERRLFVAA